MIARVRGVWGGLLVAALLAACATGRPPSAP